MSIDELRVAPDKLTRVCDAADLGFETTEEVEPLQGTIGQERAIRALELALDIDEPGFNLFISGIPGTGRNTALRAYVETYALKKAIPPDWGYVHNFVDPSRPIAISLPCGMMRSLTKDMDELIESCSREVPRAFETEDYTHRIEEMMKGIQVQRQTLIEQVDKVARQVGFTISSSQAGMTPLPLLDNQPMSGEQFNALSDEEKAKTRERGDSVQHAINHAMVEIRRLNKQAAEQTREIDKEVVGFTLIPIIDELQEKYGEHPKVVTYLDQIEADMVERLELFKPSDEPDAVAPWMRGASGEEDRFVTYRVNNLVDNTTCDRGPVIIEYSPSYYNLFGRIDYRARVGTFNTDLTMIKAGSVHRANGGFLILQARDLLSSPLSWETLKRTLRSGEVMIENIGEQYSPLPSATLRPEPIPVNVKVIVVASPDVVGMLQTLDEDFRRFFKVRADFDTVMDRTPENMNKYAAFAAARCKDGGLMPLDKTGVGKIIDYSSRLVEHQEKLTTRFLDVADIITEANYWAGQDGGDRITAEHVTKAIDEKRYRSSLTEDRLQELIEDGTIHISTDGEAVGQVNGLAVLAIGDYSFGKPSRITARVSVGRGQVMNVERETKLSGRIHDKGFLILTGYLQGKYGHDKPLSLSASVGFEQSYSEVDGDSASSTELYALLSALSELPISQNLAVTGSVNQAGEVQAIGGATQKIEGFYEVCKARGLNGQQGVIVPSDNLKNLMLSEEVVEAVRDGRFHVYGVTTIDEGIEVLTGVQAGEPDEDGSYAEGSVHALVELRLADLAASARSHNAGGDDLAGDPPGEDS